MTAHMTWLEMVFAAVSLVSMLVTLYAWRDAITDSAVLSAAKVNGPRRIIADNNIQQETLRVWIALVLVMTSWSFLYLAPPPPDYSSLPQSIAGLLGYIVIAMTVVLKSLADLSLRKKLQRYSPLEVQTQSRTVSAPVTEHASKTPVADLMRAAEGAREDQRAEDAANGKAPKDAA